MEPVMNTLAASATTPMPRLTQRSGVMELAKATLSWGTKAASAGLWLVICARAAGVASTCPTRFGLLRNGAAAGLSLGRDGLQDCAQLGSEGVRLDRPEDAPGRSSCPGCS